ncbi:exodeoxyribonuclease VII small subunit [Planctobacterium marinum]|uniref:exodeoxyribonuclease VII small subunit n=1 Tax=Planctobacterium marinum TaxID=1631968 RepID=UPI001E4CDA66|nr:exodeoxyribonuclease VII small subunit [Planctobacterium marinum]MCC2606004.1 exodeoxyribonuclease VII small subunit [Planctobacterium marinum]
MTTDNRNTDTSFEQSLQSLEKIVSAMEQGELSLEDALSSFEQGIKLVRDCEEKLKSAEQRVRILTQTDDDMTLQSFEESPDQN